MIKKVYKVSGMHCKSCEVLIETTLEELKGVKKAEVNLNKNQLVIESKKEITDQELNKLFKKNGYNFSDPGTRETSSTEVFLTNRWWWLPPMVIAGLFLILSQLGMGSFLNINSQSSLVAIFVFGLIAGFSSCGALLSGIIVTYSKKRWQILLGRILAYVIVGGLLGLLGQKIAMGIFTNILLVMVSLIMIVISLQMMGVKWALGIKINLPKSWVKKIDNKKLPFTIGLLTVFLPCGFTLLVEGVAVMSGGFGAGMVVMLAFVLGSSIPLWLIGLGSEKMIKNQKAIGLLVLFLVFYNLFLQFNLGQYINKNQNINEKTTNEKVKIIKATYTNFGVSPYQITVKKGEKVRLEIEVLVNEYGCMSTILLPGIFEKPQTLTKGKTLVMEFTPSKIGVYQFACAMDVPHNGGVVVTE